MQSAIPGHGLSYTKVRTRTEEVERFGHKVIIKKTIVMGRRRCKLYCLSIMLTTEKPGRLIVP